MKIQLPAQINATELLPFLSSLDAINQGHSKIDFSALRRVTPAGLVALSAKVARSRKLGHEIIFEGFENCLISGYLQRMNLPQLCGFEIPENFQRHDAQGRFVPIRVVDHQVDQMGHDVAACIAPGGDAYGNSMCDLYDLAWYVLTETANNTRQHSGGTGYVAAQVTQSDGMIRIAVADNGKGILRSFQDAGLDWSIGMSDIEAIKKALEPRVSSKGSPTNEGVGLTLVSSLAQRTKAWLLIVSGNGVLSLLPDRGAMFSVLPGGGFYRGTLIAVTFRRSRVLEFAEILHAAKTEAGLLQPGGITGTFRA